MCDSAPKLGRWVLNARCLDQQRDSRCRGVEGISGDVFGRIHRRCPRPVARLKLFRIPAMRTKGCLKNGGSLQLSTIPFVTCVFLVFCG